MTLGTMLIFLKCMPNPFTSHVSRCHLWTFGAWSYQIPLLPPLAEKKKLPCTCGYGSARASLQHDTSKRTSESDLNAMLAQMWYTNVILHAFKKTVHKKKLYPCPFKLCVGTKIDQHQKCHLEICHVFVCKSSPVRGMVDPWLEGLHLGA